MNWFLLFLLIPLVVVPVVLLFGFSGCAVIADLGDGPGPPPAAPSNLIAKTVGASRISLSWKDNSGGTANFVVERATIGPRGPDDSGSLSPLSPEIVGTFFVDIGLAEGTEFLYQVKAVTRGGPASVGSNYATATTFRTTQPPTWNTAFEAELVTNVELLDNKSLDDSCMIQRIDRAHLNFGGTKVRITLRGSTQSNLMIKNVSIARAPPVGVGEPWDSLQDLLEVHTGGSAAVTLPANDPPKTLDPTDYTLDPNNDLIIAFNINGGGGGARKAHLPGATMFHKPNTSEALTKILPGRSVDYATENDEVYLIEKIEVL